MTVVDAIAALPKGEYDEITVDSFPRPGLLSACPMDATTAPATMEQDKLVSILSAKEVNPLTYTIISNSDGSVATASIDGGFLQVTPLAAGTCILSLRVTDLDGNFIDRDVTVEIGWTFADWITASGLTLENGQSDDVDGDGFSNFIEYILFGDLENSNASLSQRLQVSFGALTPKDYLAIEFSTRRGINDATVYVEALNELSADSIWSEVWNSNQGLANAQVHSSSVGAESIDWVIRDTQAMEESAKRFIRVRVQALGE